MNRQARRHTQTVTGKTVTIRPMVPAGPAEQASTTAVNAHGICRSCSDRTFLWLPGRICTSCVDRALADAETESVEAMLAHLEEVDA